MSSAPATGTPFTVCWKRAWVMPSASVRVRFTVSSRAGSVILKRSRYWVRKACVTSTTFERSLRIGSPLRSAETWSGVLSEGCWSHVHLRLVACDNRSKDRVCAAVAATGASLGSGTCVSTLLLQPTAVRAKTAKSCFLIVETTSHPSGQRLSSASVHPGRKTPPPSCGFTDDVGAKQPGRREFQPAPSSFGPRGWWVDDPRDGQGPRDRRA
jgi:hypothetical protein